MANSILSKRRRRILLGGFLLAITISSWSTLSFADDYALQIAAFNSAAEADALKQELSGQDLGSVEIEESGEWFRVLVGNFDHYVDAQVAKDALMAKYSRDSFIRSFPEGSASRQSVSSRELPGVSAPFFKLEVSSTADLPVQSLRGNPVYDSLKVIDDSGDEAAYKAALLTALESADDTDPLKGYIYTNLGIMKLVEGQYDEALGYLNDVSNGVVASAAAHRIMAMYRVAWITHKQGDRLSAYRAFRQLQEFTTYESMKVKCQVECVGLLMELAESGKGTHEEVREEVQKSLGSIPEAYIKPRATVELMNVETWARQPEPDFAMAAALGEAFIAKYSAMGDQAPIRELGAAHFQTGFYFMDANNPQKAREYFNKTITDFPDNLEIFNGIHPHAQALNGLSHLAYKEGNIAAAEQILRDAIELYPDTELSRKAKVTHKELVRRLQPSEAILSEEEE